jgi:hypothetical protein
MNYVYENGFAIGYISGDYFIQYPAPIPANLLAGD